MNTHEKIAPQAVASGLQALEPLPYPVYFVYKSIERYPELVDGAMPPPVEQLYHRFRGAVDSWTLQTYVQLRRRGLDVRLVSRYVPGAICVSTYEDLAIKDFPFQSYVVTCRQDRGRPEICEQRVVQNQLNVIDATDHYMSHWPQPDLIARDRTRGSTLETLVYKGRARNLAAPFKTPEFLTELESLQVRLEMTPDEAVDRYENWTDYTTADAVIAVRNCTAYNLSIKPPSKLFNAWFAGCPALLGPEPAYQFLRESELDYLEVCSPQDVIVALRRLKEEPGLYNAIVENGFRRSKSVMPDAISQRWRDLLAGPIAEGYERWLRQPLPWKWVGRPVQFALRAFKHKRERQYFIDNIHQGPRLFSESQTE